MLQVGEVRRHIARERGYAYALWLLLGLFAFRVVGQFLQSISPVAFLPDFNAWQGSDIPYGVLLASQVAIIAAGASVALRFSRSSVAPRRTVGRVCLIIGFVYFAVMAVRLVLGLALFAGHPWFGKLIPAFFHLVLASFILVAGHFHWRYGAKPA